MISLIVYYGLPPTTMDAILATIVVGGPAQIRLNIRSKKYIDFYISLLILPKPFNSNLEKYMRKAARHLDGMDSSNPRRSRGERLHHHGGGVCWLFALLWMDS
jgi:hypothetical protein